MAEGNFISYLRVSTAKQGASGLGLEAQRKAVDDYLDGGRWKLRAEFVEIESGKRDDRPELANALKACRAYKATLVIAKLDRLSRDAHFLLGLQKAGVKFVAVDIPEANEMVVGIMAVVAQAERKMISDRTKAALAAAKARGKVLGGNRGYTPTNADRAAAAAARKDRCGYHGIGPAARHRADQVDRNYLAQCHCARAGSQKRAQRERWQVDTCSGGQDRAPPENQTVSSAQSPSGLLAFLCSTAAA